MLDEATGRAVLIEINPRPIGTTHLGELFGHDPCAPLLACLTGERTVTASPRIAGPRRIALFPKEIERDPHNLQRLRAGAIYHDVPADEPAVMALYLRRLRRIHPAAMASIMEAVAPVAPEARVTAESGKRSRAPHLFPGAFARHP